MPLVKNGFDSVFAKASSQISDPELMIIVIPRIGYEGFWSAYCALFLCVYNFDLDRLKAVLS
jgi:hypothetical protein